jgi:uncharacterized protein YbjT (DUF2867 family)
MSPAIFRTRSGSAIESSSRILPSEIVKPITATGGTGTLGRLLVPRLKASGNQVRTLSRQSHPPADGVEYVTGDLASGEGVEAALAGAKIVVHCAGSAKGDELKAQNLVKAASKSDVGHLVYISVVGADRVPIVSRVDRAMLGHFGSKFAAESLIANSGVPWTTLRATQFHELTFTTVEQMSKLPIVPVPAGFHFQPIVATRVQHASRSSHSANLAAWYRTWPVPAPTQWPISSAGTSVLATCAGC